MTARLVARLVFWLWFAAAVLAGRELWLQRLPPPGVPLVVFGLAGTLLYAYFRFASVRAWADAIDVRDLVLLHTTRFVGIYFLVLHRRGELPYEFAVPGGIGDILVAAMALPVALAPLDFFARQRAIRIWNVVGLLDILFVVATAMRLNLADPAQMRALTRLPLSLLPTLLVPLVIATHIVIFARLARAQRPA